MVLAIGIILMALFALIGMGVLILFHHVLYAVVVFFFAVAFLSFLGKVGGAKPMVGRIIGKALRISRGIYIAVAIIVFAVLMSLYVTTMISGWGAVAGWGFIVASFPYWKLASKLANWVERISGWKQTGYLHSGTMV